MEEDVKPKRKSVVITVVVIAIIGALGIVGFYKYQAWNYVETDDARVAADTVIVSPEITGKILRWNVKEGDLVKTGDVLGEQDLGSALNTGLAMGSINPQNMGPLAGSIADKAQIKSPISGQVIKANAILGAMASTSSALAVIADVENLYISANIKEDSIQSVHPGQAVDVRVDAYPGRLFHGRVEMIGRATTSTFSLLPSQNDSSNYTKVTQVIPVKIYIEDPGDAELMVGMNTSVKIFIRS